MAAKLEYVPPGKPKEKEYIDEEQISDVFTNPEKYKGKYVKLNAQIFNGPDTEDGIAAYQAYYDIVNYSKDFIFGLEDSSFAVNDYVAIDGEITDTFEGENLMGGTITCPVIKAESVTKLTYRPNDQGTSFICICGAKRACSIS